MAFELECPASEETLNRYDWEKIPLLYDSIGKKFCKKPLEGVEIDREKDLVVSVQGGSSGRDEKYIPMTYLLLMRGMPICFSYNGDPNSSVSIFNEIKNLYQFKKVSLIISKIKATDKLLGQESEIIESIKDYLIHKTRKNRPTVELIEFTVLSDVEYISC